MQVSIVIPNYNGGGLLKKNFTSVLLALKENDVLSEIVIVDDGSTDDSVEIIKQLIKKEENAIPIRFFALPKNKGFSSTVNKGVSEATGDIVVLINTDVRPERGFLRPLLSHFKDESVFAVGCLDRSKEGAKEVLRGRGVGSFRKGFLLHKRGEVDKKNTLWVSGGSSAFRKSLWEKLGGLYTLYNPFYWEDIDISYRALKSGYKVLFEEKSRVEHFHEEGAIRTHYSFSQIEEIAYRNQFYFVWLNITDRKYMLEHLFWILPHIFISLKNSNGTFLKGFLVSFQNLSHVLKFRKENRKLFIHTDYEILSQYKE